MSSSPAESFSVRAATADDAETVTELLRASEIAARGYSLIALADTLDWWRLIDLPSASWLITEGERVVAAAMLSTLREAGDFWGVVDPAEKGRGLGTALLERGEAAARTSGKRTLHVGAYAENARAAALLTGRGYRDVRHYFGMRIDLDERPAAPGWPEGIQGGTFRVDEARTFKAALDESFADEWGWEEMDFDEWRRLRLDAPDADPSLWFVARDGEELAAVARCEAGRWSGGWVGAIGVRPRWRRRGLGLALLTHAFAEFHRRGERVVRLGVDAQNPSGATRLYERAGMHVETEEIVFEKELATG